MEGGGLLTVYSLQIPETKSKGRKGGVRAPLTPFRYVRAIAILHQNLKHETYIHMFFPFFVKGNGNTLFLSVDLRDQELT